MFRIYDLSISKRLTWMNMLVSGAALLMACLAFIGYDLVTFKETAVHNLSTQAQIVASNSVSAILFNDSQSANHTLSALKNNPDILLAVVYDPGGHPFMSYSRSQGEMIPAQPSIPEGRREASHWITGKEITLVRSIEFEGTINGTVYIRSNIRSWRGVCYLCRDCCRCPPRVLAGSIAGLGVSSKRPLRSPSFAWPKSQGLFLATRTIPYA